ncbi:hypothetical protein [Streptomyces sp. SGAir0957]
MDAFDPWQHPLVTGIDEADQYTAVLSDDGGTTWREDPHPHPVCGGHVQIEAGQTLRALASGASGYHVRSEDNAATVTIQRGDAVVKWARRDA